MLKYQKSVKSNQTVNKFVLGSTCVPGWCIRASRRGSVVANFRVAERCGQTEKIPHKSATAPAKSHNEGAINSSITAKNPPSCSHEPHEIHLHGLVQTAIMLYILVGFFGFGRRFGFETKKFGKKYFSFWDASYGFLGSIRTVYNKNHTDAPD